MITTAGMLELEGVQASVIARGSPVSFALFAIFAPIAVNNHRFGSGILARMSGGT